MANLEFRYPDKPTLATPEIVRKFDNSGNFIAQDKYDGFRTQIYYRDDKIELLTRTNRSLALATNKVPQNLELEVLGLINKLCYSGTPEINSLLNKGKLGPGTVLDAEFVGPRGSHEPKLFLFDILAINGNWLTKIPYIDRWNLVKAIPTSNLVNISNSIEHDFLNRFEILKNQWITNGKNLDLCEGLVIKRKAGLLTLGLTDCPVSKHNFKVKYRDVREPRY